MMELKAPPQGSLIKDATEATFMADVIEASQEVPVIVDFWAPWCGPCKTLTPALEKAVTEAKGKVRLVKIDVDQNQRIAAQMRVQSIPAVFAFVGGQPVDGFMGAQAPAQVKAFVDRLIAMSGGDAGHRGGARAWPRRCWRRAPWRTRPQTFAAILAEDEGNVAGARRPRPLAPGARRASTRAREILALAPAGQGERPGARSRRGHRSSSPRRAPAPARRPSSRAAVERNPNDHQARYDLAMALFGEGDPRGGGRRARSSFSAATASGTRAPPRRSSSSSSTASARRARSAQKGRRRLSSMIFS